GPLGPGPPDSQARPAGGLPRSDPVGGPGEAKALLWDQLRLERTRPVARHVDAQRTLVGQHRLAAAAVAVVAAPALGVGQVQAELRAQRPDRKSTRLNSSHVSISYAVFCLKKKNKIQAL